jgi:low temperature requirement protein LtrA
MSIRTSRREEERVTPLELFFDLVFVLALTQCTSLIAHEPTWTGMAKGVLVLSVLWWAWVGYAWLTSVVDPEEGVIRLAILVAMAGFLVAALCAPEAFGDQGLTFAVAYGIVRGAHIWLFVAASGDDDGLRQAVVRLGVTTTVGVGLLAVASTLDDGPQLAVWALALLLDLGGTLAIDPTGWRLEPAHFAERHGLIIIIALGESIVAIGGGVADLDGGVLAAAALGLVLSFGMWWLYFDTVSWMTTRRLSEVTGRARNALARDAYSFLHLPMVAGIVLVAFGMHEALAHVGDPLHREPALALFGGTALYLLGHVAFYWRNTKVLKPHRWIGGVALLALSFVGTEVDALTSIALVVVAVAAVIGYENVRYAEVRQQVRSEVHHHRTEPTEGG